MIWACRRGATGNAGDDGGIPDKRDGPLHVATRLVSDAEAHTRVVHPSCPQSPPRVSGRTGRLPHDLPYSSCSNGGRDEARHVNMGYAPKVVRLICPTIESKCHVYEATLCGSVSKALPKSRDSGHRTCMTFVAKQTEASHARQHRRIVHTDTLRPKHSPRNS